MVERMTGSAASASADKGASEVIGKLKECEVKFSQLTIAGREKMMEELESSARPPR